MEKRHLGTCHTVAMKDQGSKICQSGCKRAKAQGHGDKKILLLLSAVGSVELSWRQLQRCHLALSNDENSQYWPSV